MSARIGQIIEVIEEVRARCHGALPTSSIAQVRIAAVHAVAARRGITSNSVADKFVRQLNPDVVTTSRFDELLRSWLVEGSTELREIALKHAVDEADEQLIASAFHISSQQDILLADEFGLNPSTAAFLEGRERYKLHLSKERNRALVAMTKAQWAKGNNLSCTVCGFSFLATYGQAGDGYIEAHHVTPVSELTEDTIVRPCDLVPVCSNCHGIIHRFRPWLTIDEIRQIVVEQSPCRS